MNKLGLAILGGSLGGIIVGIGVTLALYPDPSALPLPPAPAPSSPGVSRGTEATGHASSDWKPTAGTVAGKDLKNFGLTLSTDLPGTVAALRRAGFTDSAIGDFLSAQYMAQRRDRQRELWAKIARGEADPELRNSLSFGNGDRDQMLRSVLGEEAFRAWDKQNYADRVGKLNLPASEMEAYYTTMKEFEAKFHEIAQRMQAGEIDMTENSELVRAASKEQEQRLRALLGPDRYQQYQSGSNPNAVPARWIFRDSGLGEGQFAQLDRADAQHLATMAELSERSRTGDRTGSYYKDQQAAQAAREAEYQRVLGPQGWAEYQKQQDYQYRQMIRFGPAWQLSKADADYVYDSQRQYRDAIAEAQKSGTYAQRTAELQALAQQTSQNLRTYLGNERFEKLRKNGVISGP